MAIDVENYSSNQTRRLVGAGNNCIYYEDVAVASGDLVKLADSDGDLDTSDQVQLFEGFQKVFVVNGTNLKVI